MLTFADGSELREAVGDVGVALGRASGGRRRAAEGRAAREVHRLGLVGLGRLRRRRRFDARADAAERRHVGCLGVAVKKFDILSIFKGVNRQFQV